MRGPREFRGGARSVFGFRELSERADRRSVQWWRWRVRRGKGGSKKQAERGEKTKWMKGRDGVCLFCTERV